MFSEITNSILEPAENDFTIVTENVEPPLNLALHPVDGDQKRVGVWAPASVSLAWINQYLLKDVGLVPYMFHKVFGYDVTMLGCKRGEYPYLDMLSGLRMEFLQDCSDEKTHLILNIEYLREHHKDMDVLVLYGAYFTYFNEYLRVYRELRPDGKVYLALDANSLWVDSMPWTSSEFMSFLDSCDVIATSCRKTWRLLNRKWNRWTINYIPNGFYNTTNKDISVTYNEKENIILTVGRIGIKEKANHILLEAFALVHNEIPEWRVHLVGEIDDSFVLYIEKYFQKYPELSEKVIFKGLIEDKAQLFSEYACAKLFVLTSISEGMPNVISEALFHGCYQITSNIDAAEDITNNGQIGRIFPINCVSALAEILLEVCSSDDAIREAFPHILEYANNCFSLDLIIKRIHHMLFQK